MPTPALTALLTQGAGDLLRTENLPAVGLLLAFIATVYAAFRWRIVRWGADVEALLVEKDKQIAAREKDVADARADRDKWFAVAWEAGHAAQQVAETNRKAVDTTAAVLKSGRRGRKDGAGERAADAGDDD